MSWKDESEVIPDDWKASSEIVPDVGPEPEAYTRRQRVIDAIKALPGHAKRVGKKALDFQYQATIHPLDTAKAVLTPGGEGEDALRGYGQGASAGFIDELEGARGAYSEARRPMLEMWPDGPRLEGLTDSPQSLPDAYRRARDQRRHDDAISEERSPDAFGTAKLGAALTAPVKPGILNAAAYGGAYGLGASNRDLTQGEFRGAGTDIAEGMLAGAAGAVAAKPFEALGKYGRALQSRGAAADEAVIQKTATKDFGSQRGGLGKDTGGSLTKLRTAHEIVASPLAPPAMKQEAQAFIDSALGRETQIRAWQNTLDDLPNQLGQMQESRAAMDAAAAAAEPAAVAAASRDHLSKSWLVNEVAPRIDRLANNALMSAVSQPIGGAPAKTMLNLITAPHTQVRAGQAMQVAGAPGAAMSRVNPAVTQTLADYLRPKSKEEEDEQGIDWFTRGGK